MKTSFSGGVLLSVLFGLSSAQAFDLGCSDNHCEYDPTVETRASTSLQEDTDYLDFPAQAIFVLATSSAKGIAEEIRKDTVHVTQVDAFHYTLTFETVTGKQIVVPFFTSQGAENARDALLTGKSIDLSNCEHDFTVDEFGQYDSKKDCVRTVTVKRRGYSCQRTDRTPMVTSYSAELYVHALSAEAFQGPDRDIAQSRCVTAGHVR